MTPPNFASYGITGKFLGTSVAHPPSGELDVWFQDEAGQSRPTYTVQRGGQLDYHESDALRGWSFSFHRR